MANDSQIQRMPLGAAGMREAARRYLRNKSRGNADGEQEAMKAEMAEMRALIEKLSNPTAVRIREVTAATAPIDPTDASLVIPRLPIARKARGPNKVKKVARRHVIDPATVGEPSHG